MLKRIKIRSKFLAMLSAPLAAVLFFGFDGATDRIALSSERMREVRIAAFVGASGDLSTTLQIERFNTQLTDRLAVPSAEPRPDEQATDASLTRWLATADAVVDDFRQPELRSSLEEIRIRLVDTITSDRRVDTKATALAVDLGALAVSLNAVSASSASEATSIELFRSLHAASRLMAIQEELVTIANVGDAAISAGQGSAGGSAVVAAASIRITEAFDDLHTSADSQRQGAIEQLLVDDMLPRLVSSSVTDNRAGFDPALEIDRAVDLGLIEGTVAWTTDSQARATAVSRTLADVVRDAADDADAAAATAEAEATEFSAVAAAAGGVALVLAFIVGRSVSRPLTKLTEAARRLSSEELPAMFDSMRTTSPPPAKRLRPIDVRGRDEVAQLSRAFVELQSVTTEVATNHGVALRRGVADIFINLARRNQSLLDRQINLIDELERHEESPDQLESLFRLDHLATRMRRNAESLLVLAGAEPSRRRGRPVEITDVIRMAMGEIEEYRRISLVGIDAATVAGSIATDLAHLLSELMENATQFSPPNTTVVVVGRHGSDSSYQISLTDRGIGMSVSEITEVNATLAEPPMIGLEMSRSLGFTVVSRLAHRLGISVRLAATHDGGIVAAVTIPPEMVGQLEPVLTSSPGRGVTPPPGDALKSSPATPPTASIPSETLRLHETAASPVPVAGCEDTSVLSPSPYSEVSKPTHSTGDLFEVFAGQTSTSRPPDDLGADLFASIAPPDPVPLAPTSAPSPPLTASGSYGRALTGAGLVRRVPKRVDAPDVHRHPPYPGPNQPHTSWDDRSPEEVRQRLARYRSGLQRGRNPHASRAASRRTS